MHFLKLGVTAIATGVLAALTISPAPAVAQQPAPLTKQMQQPYTEARNAIIAKDWATAKTKIDAAAAQGKTPADKLALDRLRIVVATETKDPAQQVAVLNSMLSSGLLAPDEVKQYDGAMIKVYADAGDNAKSLEAYRNYLEKHGGTAEQFGALANDMVKANDNANAVKYASKAIEMEKAAGAKPRESYFLVMMRAHKQANDMPSYYAVEEQLVGLHPKDAYWRELVAGRAQGAPKYGAPARLDMFRTMQAAGVKLTVDDKRRASSEALKRGLPAEALVFLEAGIAAGELTTPEDQASLKDAKEMLAGDKAGLPKEASDALAKGNSTALVNVGEAMLSHGDNVKAIELIQAGLAKGIADPGDMDLAKLHLGIAQHRAGQKDAAKATWAEIKSNNSAAALAASWVLMSNLGM
jgi:hypothetical protein